MRGEAKTEGSPDVICCPVRLYAENYKMLHWIAESAFKDKLNLYAGKNAVDKARQEGGAVAVFGKDGVESCVCHSVKESVHISWIGSWPDLMLVGSWRNLRP